MGKPDDAVRARVARTARVSSRLSERLDRAKREHSELLRVRAELEMVREHESGLRQQIADLRDRAERAESELGRSRQEVEQMRSELELSRALLSEDDTLLERLEEMLLDDEEPPPSPGREVKSG